MIIDMSYWTRVLKRFLYVILILIGLFLAFKLAIFYTPFLIAFIISLMVEPAIRFIMKKMKFTRKTSSIIIFIIVSAIIIGAVAWGIVTYFRGIKLIARFKWICRKSIHIISKFYK